MKNTIKLLSIVLAAGTMLEAAAIAQVPDLDFYLSARGSSILVRVIPTEYQVLRETNVKRVELLKERLSAAWGNIEQLKHSLSNMERFNAMQLEDIISPVALASMNGQLGLVFSQLDNAQMKLTPCQKLVVEMEKESPDDQLLLDIKADIDTALHFIYEMKKTSY